MNISSRSLLGLSILLLATVSSHRLSAQLPGAEFRFERNRGGDAISPNQTGERVSFKFRALSWSKGGRPIPLYYKNVDSYVRINGINSSQRSRNFFDYNGPNPFTLYEQKKDEEGEVFYSPVIRQTIDPKIKFGLLLLVYRSATDTKPVAMALVDDSPDNFPWGSYQFVNLTKLKLGGNFGGHKFELRPLQSKVTSIDGDEARFLPYKLFYFNEGKNSWDNIAKNQWDFYPERRVLVFFHDTSVRYKHISTKSISETEVDFNHAVDRSIGNTGFGKRTPTRSN